MSRQSSAIVKDDASVAGCGCIATAEQLRPSPGHRPPSAVLRGAADGPIWPTPMVLVRLRPATGSRPAASPCRGRTHLESGRSGIQGPVCSGFVPWTGTIGGRRGIPGLIVPRKGTPVWRAR
jgi:hypothetical protein